MGDFGAMSLTNLYYITNGSHCGLLYAKIYASVHVLNTGELGNSEKAREPPDSGSISYASVLLQS